MSSKMVELKNTALKKAYSVPSNTLFNTLFSKEKGFTIAGPEGIFKSAVAPNKLIYTRLPISQIIAIKNYDARNDWKIPGTAESALTLEALDQAGCGSCWAFSTASMFSDRYRIQLVKNNVKEHPLYEKIDVWTGETLVQQGGDGVVNPDASAQYKIYPIFSRIQLSIYYTSSYTTPPSGVSALDAKLGCGGNYLTNPLRLFVNNGVPTSRYYNIKDWVCTSVDPKNQICKDSRIVAGPGTLYKASNYISVSPYSSISYPSGIQNIEQFIMAELYERGPITVAMYVYQSLFSFFNNYPTGIYAYKTRSEPLLGGHAVNVVGWGENETGTKYWIAKNSWGPDWGDNGYFKILRGQDFCGIESEIAAVIIPTNVGAEPSPTPTPTTSPTAASKACHAHRALAMSTNQAP